MSQPLKVKNVSQESLREIMLSLAARCIKDSLRPGYVLAVLNGGYLPAQYFVEGLKNVSSQPELLTFKLQRKTTNALKAHLVQGLKLLPETWYNELHRLEMIFSEVHYEITPSSSVTKRGHSSLKEYLGANLDQNRLSETQPLIIVDDAIDSGATICEVLRCLDSAEVPRSSIRVVAVSHTFRNPLIKADYFYYERTICHFPWADAAAPTHP